MEIQLTRQITRPHTAMQTGLVLIILLLVVGFIYAIILLSMKLLGIMLFLGGLWALLYFPWQMDYQRKQFMATSRLIGLVLIVIGIILALYG